MNIKKKDIVDNVIGVIDNGLRVVFAKPNGQRPSPSAVSKNAASQSTLGNSELDTQSKEFSASLMRVNHVGEVCAQALYQGQALTSRSQAVRDKMKHAADEEIDHLNWGAERIDELGGNISIFNPLWYAGAFTLGLGAGIAGDKWSLGFLAETERQVVDHLKSHLERLPENDTQSRKIVEQMIIDEESHAVMAEDSGAAELPSWIKQTMKMSARVMTGISEKL